MFKHWENNYNVEYAVNAVVDGADALCHNNHFCKGKIDR